MYDTVVPSKQMLMKLRKSVTQSILHLSATWNKNELLDNLEDNDGILGERAFDSLVAYMPVVRAQ